MSGFDGLIQIVGFTCESFLFSCFLVSSRNENSSEWQKQCRAPVNEVLSAAKSDFYLFLS